MVELQGGLKAAIFAALKGLNCLTVSFYGIRANTCIKLHIRACFNTISAIKINSCR